MKTVLLIVSMLMIGGEKDKDTKAYVCGDSKIYHLSDKHSSFLKCTHTVKETTVKQAEAEGKRKCKCKN